MITPSNENPAERNPTLQDMQRLLDLQKRAHLSEGSPSLALRLDRLDRLATLLTGHAEQIARAVSADFGGRSRENSLFFDVVALLESIKHAKAHIGEWMKPEIQPAPFPGSEAWVEFQPKGVIGVVSPWNFPVQLAFGPVIGILGAGNRTIVKPSELTPETSELMKRLVAAAFDEAECAVVTGGPDIAAAFTALPFDHLVFTGGTSVAHHVARAAASNLTPLTLELGGKSPVVVGASANLQQVADRVMGAKTLNAGQICLAPDYVLLKKGTEQAFVDAARAAVSTMFPTLRQNADYTSIINVRHYERIRGLLDDAASKGATIIELNPAQEDFSQSSEHRIAPTLVLQTSDDMRLRHEEIFGPVLPVLTYEAFEEALAYVNAHPRPLALYYFGQDADEERRVLQATTSGAVTVNDCMSHVMVEDLPFGGIGPSGIGAYHGRYGFLTFSHPKAIFRQAERSPLEAVVRPPFAEPTQRFLAHALGKS